MSSLLPQIFKELFVVLGILICTYEKFVEEITRVEFIGFGVNIIGRRASHAFA